MKTPIIVIPGIQGTTLSDINKPDFAKRWTGIRKFYDDLYDLELSLNGKTDVVEDVLIERSDVEDLAYSEIINYLKKKGFPVYIFGYDWRKSNMDTATELLKLLDHLKLKLGEEGKHFNFLTHSMGCLVVSCLFKLLATQGAVNQYINKVIFTVPPFMGSTEAVFHLIIGKSRLLNSAEDFRKVARTFPSMFELCPVYPGAMEFADGSDFSIYTYNDCWQQNLTKPDKDKIAEQYQTRLKDLEHVRDQNNLIFDFSDSTKLDPAVLSRLCVIAGTGTKTQEKIRVKPGLDPSGNFKNIFDFGEKDELQNDNGDGTVHLNSAMIFKDKITTFTVEERWFQTWADSRFMLHDWHCFFLNNGRVQNIINRFLNDETRDKNWYASIGGAVKKLSRK